MRRYFMTLSYDGTAYHGWQKQPTGASVQEELQRALSVLLREEVAVTGAGRTDAGVHARMMVAHFDTGADVDCRQLEYKLNKLLPPDIAVSKIVPVGNGVHARFSAVSRTYCYYIHQNKEPFIRAYSWELHYVLDFAAMNAAAAMLMEYGDFASFCKSESGSKTTRCNVTDAKWISDGGARWHFIITADRFLRNMVRAVVGTLIDVGRGRLTVSGFRKVIERRSRDAAGESAPAHALFLEKIDYGSPSDAVRASFPAEGCGLRDKSET